MSIQPKQSGNAMCQERVIQRDYAKHRQRLATTKPMIDNKEPESYKFTRRGATPHDDFRQREIDNSNRRLVDAMVHIMNTKGGIDNTEPWHDRNKAVDSQIKRNRERKRLNDENMKMLKRLEAAKPTYSSVKLEESHRQNQKHANRISRYPYQEKTGYAPTTSRSDPPL